LHRRDDSKQFRRIQLSGGSTYIISLPKNWVDDLKIKVGEHVSIVKNLNDSFTIYPKESNESKRTAVIQSSQKDSGDAIKRKIIAAYLGGYNSIQIKTKGMKIPPEHSKSIRSLVRSSMIGTEIVESSSDVIEAMEALEENDVDHANEVANMDDEIDRFSLYIRRNLVLAVSNQNILEEMELRKPSDCLGYRTITSKIERIADHASLIAKRVKFLDGRIDSKIFQRLQKLSLKTMNVFEESITAVQKHDFDKAEKVAEKVTEIIDEEKQIMNGIKEAAKNSTIIRFVLEDLRRIAEYSSDIAEIAIDENIHSIILEK